MRSFRFVIRAGAKKIKISARDIFPRRGRSLLGEFVVGALGARRHGIAATEMHFRVAVRTIVRSATGGRSRLVDLFRHSLSSSSVVCSKSALIYGKRRLPDANAFYFQNCRASVFVTDRQRVSQAACSPEAHLWHTPRAA